MAAKDAVFWDRFIFTDEKRFLLDGPDGNKKYWHDTRGAVRALKRRQAGGGGIVMWAGISARGATELVPIHDKINAELYTEVLEDGLIPFIADKYGGYDDTPVFQHDRAPSHTAKYTQE